MCVRKDAEAPKGRRLNLSDTALPCDAIAKSEDHAHITPPLLDNRRKAKAR